MPTAKSAKNEEARATYGPIDSHERVKMEEISEIAALLCESPIAFIRLIDNELLTVGASHGHDGREILVMTAYCDTVISTQKILVIEDTKSEYSTQPDPTSVEGKDIRFYAGAPLVAPDGSIVGTLSVANTTPQTLGDQQKNLLISLSKQVVDILELKKHSLSLASSKELNSKILSSMFEGMVVQNSSGQIIEFNPAALEVLGLSEGQLLGRDSMDSRWKSIRADGSPFPGEEHPAMLALKTKKSVRNIIMGVDSPAKGLKWLTINSVCVPGSDGMNAVTTFKDITELIEKNTEVESFIKGLDKHTIVARADQKGKITYVNEMFCEISGYSEEELIGQDNKILNSGYHDKEFFQNLWKTISAGSIWRGEILNRSKTGSNYWVDTTITPLLGPNGKVKEFIAFRYDITNKKLAEAELRNNEAELRQLFEQSKDAIMTLEPPLWNFTSCNQATLSLFGVESEAEFIKFGPETISPDKQDDGEYSTTKVKRMMEIALDKGAHFFEWSHKTLDNIAIPCTVLLSRIDHGDRAYIHAVVRNISAQKKLEKSITKSNNDLQASISEQLILNNLLASSTDYALSLNAKLENGLKDLFALPWLKSMPKACILLVKKDSLQLTASVDLSDKTKENCSEFTKHHSLCSETLENETVVSAPCDDSQVLGAHDHYSVPVIDLEGKVVGLILLYLNEGHSRKADEVKFLESAAKIFNIIIKTHQLQQELVDSHSYLDLALEGAGLGVWDWYLTDNSVIFDRRWLEMLGLDLNNTPMDISTWESRVHPDDIDQCHKDITSYMNGETDYYENIFRMKHLEGHWVYILGRGRFSAWDEKGKPTRFTGTNLDVSEAESTKQKLSLLYQNSPFGFAFCDIEGNIRDANSTYEKITGYTTEELKQLSYWEITPKKYEADEAKQIQSLNESGKYGPYRKEYMTKAGALVPVELNGFLVKDFDGTEGIWSIVEDISAELNQAREIQKQKQITSHQSKLASIGELAAGVGHEINNPLAIVKGYLFSIQRKMEKNSLEPEAMKTYLNKMEIATDRIATIVGGLRTFSRLDSAENSNFSPAEAIIESVNMLQEIYQKEGVSISFADDQLTHLNVVGNRGRFQQVLMNLIANAKDATLDQKNRRIDISATEKNTNLSIQVTDNGMGVPDALKEKIFDPFFTTKEVNKGTGIGLSLAHSFIKDIQGTLRVESEESKGSTFIIELPLDNTTQKDNLTATETPQKETLLFNAKAILVDDEEGIRELLSEILEDMGIQVEAVENGKLAYDLYVQNPAEFDFIISDMQMPVMDGPTLLRQLRGTENLRQPQFIFVTGGMNINFEDKGAELNRLLDGYFFKPFCQENIIEVISNCLQDKEGFNDEEIPA